MAKDFDLYRPSEEHEMLRETVRALAEAKIT
ncbi:acyl-CoA dehydrogenase family protein, partial [Streptomyces sp. SKN60]|nr:acyl-CoA dehydrogenase family protein [Streptomyces sp. SKN60]